MFTVTDKSLPKEYVDCLLAAVAHLTKCAGEHVIKWEEVPRGPPYVADLSFQFRNQLYFVILDHAYSQYHIPYLVGFAKKFNGIPCLMPMVRIAEKDWLILLGGWGLTHAVTNELVNPFG